MIDRIEEGIVRRLNQYVKDRPLDIGLYRI